MNLGDAVRDSGRLDLALGTHDTLRHCRFGYQEGSSDLFGRQATEQSEGQRHLRFRGECRVAARKHQPKPVVLHGFHLPGRIGIVFLRHEHRDLAEELTSTRLAALTIDGQVSGGRRDPAARVRRYAVARPLAQGDRERLLDCILGGIDVTEGSDEGRDRPAVLLPKNPADDRLTDEECRAAVRLTVSSEHPQTAILRSAS